MIILADTMQVVIGERRFTVREALAKELVKLFDEHKRFWEWEEKIAQQERLLNAVKRKRK